MRKLLNGELVKRRVNQTNSAQYKTVDFGAVKYKSLEQKRMNNVIKKNTPIQFHLKSRCLLFSFLVTLYHSVWLFLFFFSIAYALSPNGNNQRLFSCLHSLSYSQHHRCLVRMYMCRTSTSLCRHQRIDKKKQQHRNYKTADRYNSGWLFSVDFHYTVNFFLSSFFLYYGFGL